VFCRALTTHHTSEDARAFPLVEGLPAEPGPEGLLHLERELDGIRGRS
jgi:hypothetical protein